MHCKSVNMTDIWFRLLTITWMTCNESLFSKGSSWMIMLAWVWVLPKLGPGLPREHFKCLGSRYIHKEIEISYFVFWFNEIICKTVLKPIQTLTHKCNIIKEEHFEAIWSHTMYLCDIHNFANCVHRKGVTSFYAMTPILTYTLLYWIHRSDNSRSIQYW